MAAHIFCPTCGSKNDFANGRKPNFCMGCGYNFNSLAAFGGSEPAPRRPANQSGPALDIDTEDSHQDSRGGDDAGFSKADVEIDSVPVQLVKGKDGHTFRPVDANRQTVGDFFRHPIPPEEARQPLSTKVKGASANVKKAVEAYKNEAGANGLKRQEIG